MTSEERGVKAYEATMTDYYTLVSDASHIVAAIRAAEQAATERAAKLVEEAIDTEESRKWLSEYAVNLLHSLAAKIRNGDVT